MPHCQRRKQFLNNKPAGKSVPKQQQLNTIRRQKSCEQAIARLWIARRKKNAALALSSLFECVLRQVVCVWVCGVCARARASACARACARACVRVCVGACVRVCVCAGARVCVLVRVYV